MLINIHTYCHASKQQSFIHLSFVLREHGQGLPKIFRGICNIAEVKLADRVLGLFLRLSDRLVILSVFLYGSVGLGLGLGDGK